MPEDHVEAKDMNDALTNISKIAVGVNESKRHNENSQTILQLSQTLKTLKNPYAVCQHISTTNKIVSSSTKS
jgi:hypothetical protein